MKRRCSEVLCRQWPIAIDNVASSFHEGYDDGRPASGADRSIRIDCKFFERHRGTSGIENRHYSNGDTSTN